MHSGDELQCLGGVRRRAVARCARAHRSKVPHQPLDEGLRAVAVAVLLGDDDVRVRIRTRAAGGCRRADCED